MKNYTREEILDALRSSDRSKVMSYSQDRERVLANPILEKKLGSLKKAGERLAMLPTAAIPFSTFKKFETDGDRSEYEFGDRGYFIRRQKLEAFGLLAWLYGDPDYVTQLEDIIWAILDEYTWALPAHLHGTGLTTLQSDGHTVDLFAAETASAIAEILVLTGDKLHPIVVERARRLIRERVLDRMNTRFHWMRGSNNWVAVCGGSVGIAAIYECTDEDELSNILFTILTSLHGYLGGFTDDGVCLEGTGYWRYGFGYFMAFAELLLRRTAGRIDLFADEKVHKVASFILKCIFRGARCVSFSDADTRALLSLFAVSKLPEIYPDIPMPTVDLVDMRYPEDSCARFALEFRNFIWAATSFSTEPSDFSTYIFENAEWYVSTAKNGTSLAAKAGHNDEPHNHNDVGSFQIYKNGEELLSDIGSGLYDKDYFSKEKRYSILCNASYGHSVPIVNGIYQSQGGEYCARSVSIDECGIRSDISGAYPAPTLDSLVRDVRFDRESGAITLTDSYSFTEMPSSVIERFISRTPPEISENRITIRSGAESLTILCPDTVTVSVTTEQHRTHRSSTVPIYVIDCTVKAPKEQFTLKFEIM